MMAKKSKPIVDFLEDQIKRIESSIITNGGTIPFDFDKLVRYQTVIQFYKKETAL